jgi:hypothetical protein
MRYFEVGDKVTIAGVGFKYDAVIDKITDNYIYVKYLNSVEKFSRVTYTSVKNSYTVKYIKDLPYGNHIKA